MVLELKLSFVHKLLPSHIQANLVTQKKLDLQCKAVSKKEL